MRLAQCQGMMHFTELPQGSLRIKARTLIPLTGLEIRRGRPYLFASSTCRCQDEAVVGSDTETRLLGNLLDALDDLYDRRDRAEWWTERLLLATSVAFRGTQWELPMAEAATAIKLSLRGDGTDDAKNTAALVATGELRLQIARAL